MENKINIDNVALMFHNLGEYNGFQCWELEHVYIQFIQLRTAEFKKHFFYLVDELFNQSKTNDRLLSEWNVEVRKSSLHSNSPKYGNSYYLKAGRSSMCVEYEVEVKPFDPYFYIKKYEYEQGENVLKDSYKLAFGPSLEIRFTEYQRLSLFSNWFYYLYNEAKREGVI
jgi:hypothetical protein